MPQIINAKFNLTMIQFKDIRAGHTLHLFDKERKEYTPSKVESVKPPYFATTGVQKVIDITLQVWGENKTYVVPEDASVAYDGTLMIATDKEQVKLEVQGIRGAADARLKLHDSDIACLERCDKVLELLDETIAEKRETERRFASIEQKLNELISKLT